MPNTLLSGPAGAGKSQRAQSMVASGEADAVIDFQSILAAVLQLRRGEDGRYPPRDASAERVMPLVEAMRRDAIDYAVSAELEIVATNSDGDPERRQFLLDRLGVGATEIVIDPGREIVEARLADSVTGELTEQCSQAIGRFYDRI